MVQFSAKRLPFGQPPAGPEVIDDDGTGLPTPARVRLRLRRQAGIAEAREILAHLPEPGESVHAIMTARMDLSDVLHCLLDRLGRCERMTISTLSYNERNLKHMLSWIDAKTVGSLTLLASIFFRSHKIPLWEATRAAFTERGQRCACAHSHAKTCTLLFANGTKLAIEGSANLCSNGSGREQIALVNDPGLHDFHAGWVEGMVAKAEG